MTLRVRSAEDGFPGFWKWNTVEVGPKVMRGRHLETASRSAGVLLGLDQRERAPEQVRESVVDDVAVDGGRESGANDLPAVDATQEAALEPLVAAGEDGFDKLVIRELTEVGSDDRSPAVRAGLSLGGLALGNDLAASGIGESVNAVEDRLRPFEASVYSGYELGVDLLMAPGAFGEEGDQVVLDTAEFGRIGIELSNQRGVIEL